VSTSGSCSQTLLTAIKSILGTFRKRSTEGTQPVNDRESGDRACFKARSGSRQGRSTTSQQAPIPCTYLSSNSENDSCPIVSEPVHLTFASDRLSSPVALRSGRSRPIVRQVTCAPDGSQTQKVSASVVASIISEPVRFHTIFSTLSATFSSFSLLILDKVPSPTLFVS